MLSFRIDHLKKYNFCKSEQLQLSINLQCTTEFYAKKYNLEWDINKHQILFLAENKKLY